MQGWWDRCKEMQYSLRKPCSFVEALGITFSAMGVPACHPHITLTITTAYATSAKIKKTISSTQLQVCPGSIFLAQSRYIYSKLLHLKYIWSNEEFLGSTLICYIIILYYII